MLFGVVIALHIVVALFLIVVVLLQGGRGGMAEAMGGVAAQSLFGGGANVVMTKLTAGVAAVFMITCLSLAFLSTTQGRSVTEQLPMSLDQLPAALPNMPGKPSAPTATTPAAPTPAPAAAPSSTPATSSTTTQ